MRRAKWNHVIAIPATSGKAASNGSSPRGFSRAELIVCTLVVMTLLLIAGPWLLRARSAAREQTCRNRLKALTAALHYYHDFSGQFPPAAVWNADAVASLALHASKRIDVYTHSNWAILLLPHLNQSALAEQFDGSQPIGAAHNLRARTSQLLEMSCPNDSFNRADNPYRFTPSKSDSQAIEFARGNFAFNGGTQCYRVEGPSTSAPNGDYLHLTMQDDPRRYELWGNGIGGINKTFSLQNFENGQGTLVALEEVRAGISSLDTRGVWALGQIGASITWAHGVNGDNYGPNNQWSRSDDILGCRDLHEAVGTEALINARMPCVDYVDINQQATSRSMHPGGVHVSFVDGSVRRISDDVNPGLWHVMHSRETPRNILAETFDRELMSLPHVQKAPSDVISRNTTSGEASLSSESPAAPWTNSIGMEFVNIASGDIDMGLPDSGNASPPENSGVHQVRITEPFAIGIYEVTIEQFHRIQHDAEGADQRTIDTNENHLPVSDVTWDEAIEFCARLSALPLEVQAGRRYRLPTEAEWEYACRAGRRTPYLWTPNRSADDASGDAAGVQPPLPLQPVGSYPPNLFGLYDTRGNVWEWTADWYDRNYYSWSPVDDPQGPAVGYLKVVRGSDWRFVGEPCHIDYPAMPPWKSNPFVGFRVVCRASVKTDS